MRYQHPKRVGTGIESVLVSVPAMESAPATESALMMESAPLVLSENGIWHLWTKFKVLVEIRPKNGRNLVFSDEIYA